MLDHADLVHMPKCRFTIQSQHRDALSRQVGEAIAIMHSRDALLNSKSEYLTNCLTRVTVEERDWERKQREMEEELKEKNELEKLERFIKEKEAAARNILKNNEKAEQPAFKKRKVEPPEPSTQSPMTINASETSQADSINMLTGSSKQQEDQDQPTHGDRWSHHHHYDLRKWWGRMETFKDDKPAKRMHGKSLRKPAKRNQNYHLAWFNLWWSRMNIEAKIQTQSRRMQEYLENKDDLRMTPKRAGLTHTGPSNYDTCKMPSPAEIFSKLTLSSRKRSNNLELCSTQSPAKKVKAHIHFVGEGGGGEADGQNLHTEPAKITKFSAQKPNLNRDSDYL